MFLLPIGEGESVEENPQNFVPDLFNRLEKPLHDIDLNAVYLGLQENPLPKSPYRPTRLADIKDTNFYSIIDFIVKPELVVGKGLNLKPEQLEKIVNMNIGEVLTWQEVVASEQDSEPLRDEPRAVTFTNVDLHDYTLSFGRDENGIYTSIYDVWDFTPTSGFFHAEEESNRRKIASAVLPFIGKPIHLYDRLYWKNYERSE